MTTIRFRYIALETHPPALNMALDEACMEAVRSGAAPPTIRVYHDAEGEVTYSLIAPEGLFPSDISAAYVQLCGILIDAFAELGVAAEFRPINDISVAGKKVSGNAQTRRGGVLLQHGTVLLTVDPARMFQLLTPDKSKLSDKPFIASVNSAVTCLAEHGVPDRATVERALLAEFHKRFPGDAGAWTAQELARAHELVTTRYGTQEWTHLR